jgi:1-deoxy-D-xylulose 5-phosphate reductoisomerase
MSEIQQQAPRRITILGATGSIGCNTLDVMAHLGGRDAFEVPAITGMGNIDLLAKQARQMGARLCRDRRSWRVIRISNRPSPAPASRQARAPRD